MWTNQDVGMRGVTRGLCMKVLASMSIMLPKSSVLDRKARRYSILVPANASASGYQRHCSDNDERLWGRFQCLVPAMLNARRRRASHFGTRLLFAFAKASVVDGDLGPIEVTIVSSHSVPERSCPCRNPRGHYVERGSAPKPPVSWGRSAQGVNAIISRK
jgi:hypothetical protein